MKVLYNPSGFSSVFILFNDFFKTKPENFKDIETYLNKVKRLVTKLKAHTIKLAPQLILYWVMANLDSIYEGFVSNVTQALRKDPKAYDLESLTVILLDKSKRQK